MPSKSAIRPFLIVLSHWLCRSSFSAHANSREEPEIVGTPGHDLRESGAASPVGGRSLRVRGHDQRRRSTHHSSANPTTEGQIVFANKPPEAGQNLPAEVKIHQAFIENQEEGDYLGGQELVSQLGTTFYSRGRYLVDGDEIEETVVFALHPYADRIMTITYRYPAGVDSSIRVQQLFDVLAMVEGLD